MALVFLGFVLFAATFAPAGRKSEQPQRTADDAATPGASLAKITIDYPEEGSVFPPEITPPTFLWRDRGSAATEWRIDVSFADRSAAIQTTSRGERMRLGSIDPRCVSDTNRLPRLTPQQLEAHTWTPDAAVWRSIKKHSLTDPATVTITGLRGAGPNNVVSRGQVTILTSKDPVGAPVFYRDVPLMPAETEKGVIEPLALHAVRLVSWRIRNVGEPRSRLVMENLPMCANCHSFSADGRTMGMDLDGLQNNRGMYALVPVQREMAIRNEDVIQWRSDKSELKGKIRVGFMSQVSPDGQYVVTTLNPAALDGAQQPVPPSNYYVANFKDYKFLQVFYPVRGFICWYSRATGILQPLPGADDRRFVQMGAVWSPDGKYLVFARAAAKDPNPEGVPPARFANDPNELQVKYDLYRMPFNGGKGGKPEPIDGASRDGMSNSFPKVSPDGRWIVFVKSGNGMLMRPDSQLYIVPAGGGQARRMRCNTSLMNSWHSFAPNGRWLVFSSKRRSPYTQMYLTHIDEQGNDSPAILIDKTTAANRAVNIPEFVNIPQDGLREIGGPAIEFYRLYDQAAYLQKEGRFEESAAEWRKALELNPDEPLAQNNLSMVLLLTGHLDQAIRHFQRATELKLRKALEFDPGHAPSYNDLGTLLMRTGRIEEAVSFFRKAAELEPGYAPAQCSLGGALAREGSLDEALVQLTKALELDPGYAPTHYNLGLVSANQGDMEGAVRHWQKALEIDPSYADAHNRLGNALYAQGRTGEALAHWRTGIQLQPNDLSMLRQTAWVLATCREPSMRNGSEALKLALRAVQISGGSDPAILDTLGAAYAEQGRFADAALTARKALDLAAKSDQQALAQAVKNRIALYESAKPYRDNR